jgi:hypothetical protein
VSRPARAALLVACALVAAALALVPSPSDSPLGRVASLDGDGPDPRYDTRLDGAAIRRAGGILPDATTYAVAAPGAPPLLAGNLKAATQLFLAPALPVQDARAARWVLVYGPAAARAPAGSRIAPQVALVRRPR